jgi:tricorn protease-like protein
MKLRDALGDSADKPLYIETIPKRGYRFVAPVTVPAATQNAIPSSQGENAIATPARPMGGESEIADQVRPARPSWFYLAWLGAAIVLAFLGLTFFWMVSRPSARTPHGNAAPSASASEAHSSELISLRGSVSVPKLSPDAKEIAFIWNGENLGGDLYVQLIRSDRGDEKPLRLTHTSSGSMCCASWSQDGRELAYGYCGDNGGAVFTVSALGGAPRRITDVSCRYGMGGWPLWAPDGNSLLIIDRCAPNTAPTLMRLSLATGAKHCIGQPLAGLEGDFDPVLSPDGKTLAFIRFTSGSSSDIYTLTLNTGKIHRVTEEGKAIWAFMWTADSRNIVFRSSRGGLSSIWRISASGGAIEKESVYPQVGTLSADGRRLVYLTNQGATSYFLIPGMPTTIMRADLSAAGGHVIALKDVIA